MLALGWVSGAQFHSFTWIFAESAAQFHSFTVARVFLRKVQHSFTGIFALQADGAAWEKRTSGS
jgi:hypothetical protein